METVEREYTKNTCCATLPFIRESGISSMKLTIKMFKHCWVHFHFFFNSPSRLLMMTRSMFALIVTSILFVFSNLSAVQCILPVSDSAYVDSGIVTRDG